MDNTPKTVEELQQQIDAQREQNIIWISNIAVVLKDHETMLREIKDTQRDMARLLTRLVEQKETNGTG